MYSAVPSNWATKYLDFRFKEIIIFFIINDFLTLSMLDTQNSCLKRNRFSFVSLTSSVRLCLLLQKLFSCDSIKGPNARINKGGERKKKEMKI